MSDDNTHGGSEPSLASAGSQNTHMATARLAAANTWLQEEIKRLSLTDEEREAIEESIKFTFPASHPTATTLRNLLQRTK
jgi:hypothetical protein